MNAKTTLPKGCKLVSIPHVGDKRGDLVFAEAQGTIPFDIQRVFWIYNIPTKTRRGGHAHWTCSEVVVPIKGAFTMMVDDGTTRAEVRMESPSEGILIPAGVWCELKDFAPDTILVVMASEQYDATGYIHDYTNYLKALKQ